jgi:2-methylaconitate cis-trans-isomerase PrpF
VTNWLNCTIMRGGTSKAVFLRGDHLPIDQGAQRDIILQVFGSPDKRQIDGLGGADPLTSKLAIIDEPSSDLKGKADLVYSFGQVEINVAEVDWHSLCGNITSAVGLYAVQDGFVTPQAPVTRVRVYNTNLKRFLYVEVPVENGVAVSSGDYTVPGVPGSGAAILIDFADTAGGATGELLPTGNPVDLINVDGIGPLEMSLVDIGNAHVFVRAADLGLSGIETPSQIDADPELLARLESIRSAAAARIGMASSPETARAETPATPILGVIAPPMDYPIELTGGVISANEVDVVSRLQFMQQTHKTYAGTSTACTGVASRIDGTIVQQAARPSNDAKLRIGHPAGVIDTEAIVERENGALIVKRATLGRTARRILDGKVYLKG